MDNINNSNINESIMEGIRRHVQSLDGLETTQILEISPGHSRLAFTIPKGVLNLYGNLHGGAIFALCDTAAGMAAYAYGVANVTQCSSIQFLRGISEGTIYIEANAIHKGRRTVVNQVNITNEDGKLVATANFTMFLTGEL
ncbi:PaaI family thioesterase [Clostridium sp. AN503]|uniref:PaaI family thioesterase n=1 Tax=Clostridium sp. AN503 TaxID=3160598 RepID=UPI003459485B